MSVKGQSRGWIVVALFALCHTVWGAQPDGASGIPDLIQRVDSTMQHWQQDKRFSAAAVAIVDETGVLLSKGYGEADASGRVVDESSSQFMIGSVSKVITASALMQLVDRGLIASLEDPANKYLVRVQIEKKAGREISVRDLMTHNAGFEDRAFGLATRAPVSVPLSAHSIQGELPKIVRDSGLVYSNASASLIGLMIEDVTGMGLDRYLMQNVFGPLQMHHADPGYAQTAPADLVIPQTYYPNGTVEPGQVLIVHPFTVPAGGYSASANDMAHFMLAHLGVEPNASRLLSEASRQAMHRRSVHNHPAMPALGIQFLIDDWNAERVSYHGGAWPGFSTILILLPDRKLGFFASFASGTPNAGVTEQLLKGVVPNRMTPLKNVPQKRPINGLDFRDVVLTDLLGPRRPPAGDAGTLLPALNFAGIYLSARQNFTTAERLIHLLTAAGGALSVAPQGPHGLTVNGRLHYRQIAPGVFWSDQVRPDSERMTFDSPLLAFWLDSQSGEMRMSQVDDVGYSVRQDGMGALFAVSLFNLGALAMLTGLLALAWPAKQRLERWSRYIPVVGMLCVVLIVGVLMAGGGSFLTEVLYAERFRFVLCSALAMIIGALALGAIAAAVISWRRRFWGEGKRALARRIHFSIVAAGMMALVPLLLVVHLVPLNL